MRHTLLLLLSLLTCSTVMADHVDVVWPMTDKDNLAAYTQTAGSESMLTPAFVLGSNLNATGIVAATNADAGYTAVSYNPPFVQLTPTTRVTAKTAGHYVAYIVKMAAGHTFKPTTIELDAAKFGTDGGNFDVYIKVGSEAENALATAVVPLRNKITASNSTGFSHHSYSLSDILISGGTSFQLILYVYNFNGQDNENPKSIGFRGVTIRGETDEPIYDASYYFPVATCSAGNMLDAIGGLHNGQTATWPATQYGDPTNFYVTAATGYTASVVYNNKVATLRASRDGQVVFSVQLRFVVSNRQPKPDAVPLDRGLLAVKVSSGVLVSWRYRATDDPAKTRFRLYRGKVRIGTNPITERTNYLDTGGTAASKYTLEVVDGNGNVVERQADVATWASPCLDIPTQTPTDTRGLGATYTPNDASVCDMDGDGQYEIILKWDPSNSKDAASNGVTSDTYIDCIKLDGTLLWRVNIGPNLRSGAHTTPFLAYDFDGDGYGELICKTAPGTVDGEGNYVVMDGDDPLASWLNGRGKPDDGPEYLTVFDGLTGGNVSTVRYHTCYGDVSASGFWGDSNQNRSERYLACMAYLDGTHPSAVFCRGYYRGASVGAYDFDGTELKLRWLHRSSTSGKELWGEGAHSVTTGDYDGDGRDEITYGSAALDDDGTLLYRTGQHHGDALHTGDFDPSRPGQETFMVHEESPYGHDLRDAATGALLIHVTASGDTGRGLIADFDDENEGFEFGTSASYDLFNIKGETIGQWNSGTTSSSTMNYRIYWDGDLYDEYHDRQHIDKWSSANKSFGRVNTLYSTYGAASINGTKNNPNLQADFLGDWREEIIYYNASNNHLLLISTDLTSDYRVPFLMDDRQYAEAIVWQNVGYNQPPHLSYNLISAYTIEKTFADNSWSVLYAPYPVRVPADVEVYSVPSVATAADTLRRTRINSGATLPTGACVLVRAKAGTVARFVPSIKSASTVSATYLKGCSVDSVLTCNTATYEYFYTLTSVDDDGAMAFVRVPDGHVQPAGTPWMRVKGTANYPPKDVYYIEGKDKPVGINSAVADPAAARLPVYDLSGRPADSSQHGVCVAKGHLFVR